MKSPAYLKAVAPLFRLQRQLLSEFKIALERYIDDLEKYKAAKKQAKEEGTEPPESPERPVLRRVVCSDTTIEKLAEILEDNQRGTLLARDELAGWLASFCRYKGKQGGTDLPNWLEMFRAGTVIVDRKTGERRTLFIPRSAVSVAGGIQPGVLARALTPEFLDADLAARLLMAMPPKLPKQWSEVEIAPETEIAYQDLLDRLLALNFAVRDTEQVPHVLHLDQDARSAWIGFYNGWAHEQAAVEGEAFSKLEAYAARFALLHHVVTHAALDTSDLRPVGKASVEAGIVLCRWFANEARRIYATLTETVEERDTRRLVEFIRSRGGAITVKELQRSNSRKYPTAGDALAALDALVDRGLGRWEDRPAGPQGGRPSRVCALKKAPDDTDETSPDGDEGDGGPTTKPPDETPPQPDGTLENTLVNGVSSVSSGAFSNSRPSVNGVAGTGEGSGVSSGASGVSSGALGFRRAPIASSMTRPSCEPSKRPWKRPP